MKSAYRWKLLLGLGLIAFLAACAPKRKETQFSKNKQAESGQTYTEDQLRAALGSDRYDALVMGMGAANLNLLTYGIGISNMTQLINGITGPGKLVALMSDGSNSRKLTAIQVLDLLNKLDDACSPLNGAYINGSDCDTLGKMVNMINKVTLAGMDGVKNIVHGVQDQPSDINGVTNGVSRLAFLIALLNETKSVMPTLVNDLAAPRCWNNSYTNDSACTNAGGTWQSGVSSWSSTSGECLFPERTMLAQCTGTGFVWEGAEQAGKFSSVGNAKLIRLVNLSQDMRDLAVIINDTTVLSNITSVMAGLTGNIYCSKPQYETQGTCTTNGGSWKNAVCSNPVHSTRAACVAAGATWTSDGIDNMSRIINELDRRCSDSGKTNGTSCIGAGATWHTKASKIPVIVNNITVVANMFNIVNGLSNDGRRPPWPTGLPVAYPGDAGNVFDGVDSMVATLNTINVPGMGDPASANTIPFGTNGVKRLAYMVNNLDVTPVVENDSDFEGSAAPYDCVNGLFDNRLNWAFSDNGNSAAPWYGKSWRSGGGVNIQAGSCSLRNDPTAATASTATQSAELLVNLTTPGNATFYTKTDTLGAGDVLRVFINDSLIASYTQVTGGPGFQLRTIAMNTGVNRIRFDVHRALGSTGQVFVDTMVLPGTKGAARTAAEKTAIMLNYLYIQSSITNVADLLNNTTAPACISTPNSCIPTNNNGVDALIYAVNRAEYPANILTIPRLATTVNDISNLNEMYGVLNNLPNLETYKQLVAMIDFVQTPANIPALINALGAGGGAKTASILSNITAAGTSNMLRVLADSPAGAPIGDTATLINGATATSHIGTILTELPLSSNVNIGGVETFFSAPTAVGATGGVKLAQFFNRIKTVGDANAQNCTSGTESDFCIKNHLVRLVNDVANSPSGPVTIAAIVGGMRPDNGPGGSTGVERMTDAMFYLKSMNAARYGAVAGNLNALNPVDTSKLGDDFGRLDAFIADLGASGGATTARLVNEVTSSKITTHVGSLIQNTNRIKYLSRFVSELTNVTLIIDILNGLASAGKIQNLMNDMGDTTASFWGAGTDLATLAAWNSAIKYTNMNEFWATDSDKLGKTITFMNNISGGSSNVVTLLNGINFTNDTNQQRFPILKDLVKDVHRVSYVTRILNESSSVNLVISLINAAPIINPSTGSLFTEAEMIARITSRFGGLVNEMGDATTKPSTDTPGAGCTPTGTPGADCAQPTTKYGDTVANFGNGCAAMPGFSNGRGCDTNIADKLGRVITMLNEITAISNTVALMLGAEDFGYIKSLINNTSATTPTGVRRMRYLTYIVNNLTNVELMVRVINGADACSRYVSGVNTTTDTAATCATALGTWGGVGRCVDPANPNSTAPVAGVTTLTTKAACTTTSTRVWRGAEYNKLLGLINAVGDSELKGNVNTGDLLGAGMGTKAVGELYVLVDTMNQLGYSGAMARSLGQQVRVVRVINQVQYCGLVSTYDKTIQQGPTCVNASNIEQPAYQFREACLASGNLWRAKYNNAGTSAWVDASTMFFDCNDPSYQKPTAGAGPTVYYTDGDRYDGRNRLATTMLGVTDGAAFSVVVGDVQETQKTINMLNGVRRVRALSQFVKWTPGGVTAALINDTHWSAVLRSLIYLANNLEDTEDETAKAFASMVHFGTKIVAQNNTSGAGNATPTPCLEFSGLGPRRLAAVLNLEAGPYLEGVIAGLGWQMSIAAMNCGWAVDAADNQTTCPANAGAGWPTNGGMRKAVGRSYVGLPKPVDVQCVYSKEITAGYSYGNYTWAGSKGISQTNCELLMPETSGAPVPLFGTQQKATDAVIWQGFSPLSGLGGTLQAGIGADNCTGEVCADMWSILKGTGGGTGGIDLIGTLMTQDNSFVGFPPPRVFNDTENCTLGLKGSTSTTTCTNGTRNTVCTGDSTFNGNNWQCLRTGLIAGDLEGSGSRGYWGTYCAAGDADRSNLPTGSSNCISRGGKWTTEKNYSGPSCQVDPSAGPSARVGP